MKLTITDRDSELVLAAGDVLSHRSEVSGRRLSGPPAVVLCIQPSTLKYAVEKYGGRRIPGFYGEVFGLKKTSGRVAVAGRFGIGAPALAAVAEELVAGGARRLLAVGLAGGLQAGAHAGDIVICDRAFRGEGTSHYYAPPSDRSCASSAVTSAITRRLSSANVPFEVGSSWTTDAPYRETRGEVERYRREGVKAVEMESAALFAVGQCLGVAVGAAFSIGDIFDGTRWRLDSSERAAERSLRTLLDAAVAALQEEELT
ncbi:MAG: nucleoside phosphorylase [Chloroflexi bacterium]|nr:nucleoside phosphorylase [Chloroflexota bacterium]